MSRPLGEACTLHLKDSGPQRQTKGCAGRLITYGQRCLHQCGDGQWGDRNTHGKFSYMQTQTGYQVQELYFMSFFSRLLMKSLASSEISSKASSSKSHVAEVTLARVSLSLSPIKGESPLTLGIEETERHQTNSVNLQIIGEAH